MIEKFTAKNYGCLKNVEAVLTPLHAFIGPNDSGKSTLLRGIRTLAQLAGSRFELSGGELLPFDPALGPRASETGAGRLAMARRQGMAEARRHLGVGGSSDTPPTTFLSVHLNSGWYSASLGADGFEEGAQTHAASDPVYAKRRLTELSDLSKFPEIVPILHELRGARMLRLDPDALRLPSGLVLEEEARSLSFVDERGANLPGILYALREFNSEAFATIEEHIRKLFPTVRAIKLPPASKGTLAIEVELGDGSRARGHEISEGLLYCLAFLVLPHLAPASVILVEEPENGLHPARVAEVVRLLRALVETSGTQVLIATHSPLVVNELRPEEVTVVTRPSLERGAQLTPIRNTHNFKHRAGVYSLGELWLSYSDGDREAALFDANKQ